MSSFVIPKQKYGMPTENNKGYRAVNVEQKFNMSTIKSKILKWQVGTTWKYQRPITTVKVAAWVNGLIAKKNVICHQKLLNVILNPKYMSIKSKSVYQSRQMSAKC